MAAVRAAEVEVLFTVNDKDVARAEKSLKVSGDRIEKKPIKATIDADEKGALGGIDRVTEAARKLVSKETVVRVDAQIEKSEAQLDKVKRNLDYLQSVRTELNVEADIKRAESSLQRIERQLSGLKSARVTFEVDADTAAAETALDDIADAAGDAGEKGGLDAGSALVGGIVGALSAIPIAGALGELAEGITAALKASFQDGLAIDARLDRLGALTGLDEADAQRLGLAAGEAYASNFGESIEANMDTTRLALQFQILDGDASSRAAQKVVSGLAGIADALGEDVAPVARTVAVLLSSGVAKSAENAYDLLATGAREGLNRNEDLLDTLTEYPALFARLGLSGDEALGLISQGLKAGARDSDKVADALKELQIRATDGSDASRAAYEAIGLSADDMTAKIARGGEGAKEGLDQILDGLRAMEDPVARNAAAVGLFGTQAEDLGDALFALDLSTAVEQLNGVTGAAQAMFDRLSDNDAAKMEQAQRNIEVAVQGIQGALAAAFSEPLGEFSDWVSQNRGPVLQFFLDLANGALDFAETATDSFGAFVSGPLAEMLDGLIEIIDWTNGFEGKPQGLVDLAEGMHNFTGTTDQAKDAIEAARDRLNEFGGPVVQLGMLNDASVRLAGTIGQVGFAADGSQLSLEGMDVASLRSTESGALLESQVRASIAALGDEVNAARDAGESQEDLKGRYESATTALVDQLTQMGLTEDQARALIDTVLQTPTSATTEFDSNAQAEQQKVQDLAGSITNLPDGTVSIDVNTWPAQNGVDEFIRQTNGRVVRLNVQTDSLYVPGVGAGYHGGLVEFMARGGIPNLTPMDRVASVVSPNTWRVVGDRGDVPESFIPIDGSARSMAILLETNRLMGLRTMGDGGISGAASSSDVAPIQVIQYGDRYAVDPAEFSRADVEAWKRARDTYGI